MSSFEDRKFTRQEVAHALRLCSDGGPCEQCEFFEAECPRGYNPCYEELMMRKAADFIEERTAKVETVEKPNVFKCGKCGQYFHSTSWGSPVEYCSRCGAKLDWDENIPMEYFESGGK